jgi:precorrin-2 dehydrogenase/sirohydrochlorin ferrochelatase
VTLFPVMLHADAIAALVVGGGSVATRRALSLLDAGAAVRVVAPRLDERLREAAARCARLRLDARPFAPEDLDGVTLVVAATDDGAVNDEVARLARERGLLVNVADRPEAGTFSAAAVHRAGRLVVAVAAGGVPTAAARVRDAIAGRLDDRYAQAIDGLATLRARLLGGGDAEGWRRASAELTGPDFAAAVESGAFAERVRRWG